MLVFGEDLWHELGTDFVKLQIIIQDYFDITFTDADNFWHYCHGRRTSFITDLPTSSVYSAVCVQFGVLILGLLLSIRKLLEPLVECCLAFHLISIGLLQHFGVFRLMQNLVE